MAKPRTGDRVRVAVSGQGSLALTAEEILEAGDLEGKWQGWHLDLSLAGTAVASTGLAS